MCRTSLRDFHMTVCFFLLPENMLFLHSFTDVAKATPRQKGEWITITSVGSCTSPLSLSSHAPETTLITNILQTLPKRQKSEIILFMKQAFTKENKQTNKKIKGSYK